MAFTGIGKLIKDLVTGTPADTDYFAFGNTDLKKVSFPNLKKALGIDALNSAMKRESFTILTTASEVSTKVKFSSKFNRVPTVVVTPTFQGWRLSKPIQVSDITTDGFTATAWIENDAISSDTWITVEYMAIALGA